MKDGHINRPHNSSKVTEEFITERLFSFTDYAKAQFDITVLMLLTISFIAYFLIMCLIY